MSVATCGSLAYDSLMDEAGMRRGEPPSTLGRAGTQPHH
jgi:geranylgeranyl pyrophosphate synthase